MATSTGQAANLGPVWLRGYGEIVEIKSEHGRLRSYQTETLLPFKIDSLRRHHVIKPLHFILSHNPLLHYHKLFGPP